jgi:eukaryotic-like serine/threonine-protein kinase
VAEWSVPGFTGVRTLGSGGSGEVVLARHTVSGTSVAVKYLRPYLLADGEFTRLFRAEAAVLATVEDPHVVRLYEYVESLGGAAIVMELIDGVCLREILADQGTITAEAALVVLQDSLLGLAAAHRRGVVHRDYKPENVLVTGDGHGKLTDFGVATRSGHRPILAGDLAYAPPEQFAGSPASPASPASDVYAATATFYECLAGYPPFTGDTTERLLYEHLTVPVPLDPIPEPLRPLVAAGMAKNPVDRPTDFAAFITQLGTVAVDTYGRGWHEQGRSDLGEAARRLAARWPSGTSTPPPDSAPERIHRARRIRGRHVAIAIAAAAVVAVTGAALAVGGSRPHTAAHSLAAVQQISLQPSSPPAASPAPKRRSVPAHRPAVSSSWPAVQAGMRSLTPEPTPSRHHSSPASPTPSPSHSASSTPSPSSPPPSSSHVAVSGSSSSPPATSPPMPWSPSPTS